jgi:ADP-heptose:LPS heptosyltransferase
MPTLKPVVIHPGSGGRHKCWHLRNFLSVARMLANEGAEVVFLLGPAEREQFSESETAEIKRTGRTLANLTLADVLAVLGCARGFIGNDSGIMHLAAALGIRTVAVFGPTDPVIYGPLGPAVTILRSDSPDFTNAISEDLRQRICEILLA